MRFRQLHPMFVAQAIGVDLRQLPTRDVFPEIATALDRQGVLVFRDQMLPPSPAKGAGRRFEPR
jgi:hypothetical protein